MGEGNCLKYLKRGGTERRGEDPKIFKNGRGGGKLGQGMGLLASNSPHFLFYGICSASKSSTSANYD